MIWRWLRELFSTRTLEDQLLAIVREELAKRGVYSSSNATSTTTSSGVH